MEIEELGPIDLSAENTNKKSSYFVVDGGREMFMDDPSGKEYGKECSFVKALKAIYSLCIRYCVTDEARRHLVGILVINTSSTEDNPDVLMGAENTKHIFPLGYLDKEKVMKLSDLINTDDLKTTFFEMFGGHTRSNYQKVASHSKLNVNYVSTSKRFVSWIHLTNNLNPFSANWCKDEEYLKMLRNLHDIEGRKATDDDVKRKSLSGRCSVLILGHPELTDADESKDIALEMWRSVDDQSDVYNKEFESVLFQRTGAIRAFSVIPFNLGDDFNFNVSVFSICVQKVKPTPSKHYKGNLEGVKSVTMYTSQFPQGPDLTQKMETNEDNEKNVLFGANEMPRRMLSHVKKVGGETIVLDKNEVDSMQQYTKGIRLIEFRPISEVDVWEHVRAPWMIRPHEESLIGSTSLYSHLLNRMDSRQMAAICEYCSRSNQRPRHIALLPNTVHDPEKGLHRGFYVVELHDYDDKLDIGAAFDEKMKEPNGKEKWTEASQSAITTSENFCNSILKKRFTPIAYANPHLQAFYTMLRHLANLEEMDETSDEWMDSIDKLDHIKSWYDNPSMPPARMNKVERIMEDLAEECDIKDWDPEAAKSTKRKAQEPSQSSKTGQTKKVKKEDRDESLRETAEKGGLSKLTVIQLRTSAAENGIDLRSAKRKDDIIETIMEYYKIK